jgi:hypothetical protein
MTPEEAAATVRTFILDDFALNEEETVAALDVLVAAAQRAERLSDDQAVMRGVRAFNGMGIMRVGDIHDHAEAFRAALADDGGEG